MKVERVFVIIQRINAVILLVLGIGGMFLLGAGLWDLLGLDLSGSSSTPRNGAPTEAQDLGLELANVGRVAHRHIFVLEAVRESAGGLSSGSSSELRNLLFVNLDTGESRWLLDGFGNLIAWDSLHSEEDPCAGPEDASPSAILYCVIDRDTNGDGQVTLKDNGSIAISAANGVGYRVLVEHVQNVRSYQRDGGTAWIFFDGDDGIMLAEINLEGRRLTRVNRVAAAQPG